MPSLTDHVIRNLTAAACAAVPFAVSVEGQMAPERWLIEEEVVIGARSGVGALTMVQAVALTGDERFLFVAQPAEYVVKRFDASSGDFLGAFGGQGAGPGEFGLVTRVTVRGDTVVVADKVQQRIALFDTAGAHLETATIRSSVLEGSNRAVAVAVCNDSTYWAEPARDIGRVASGREIEFPLLLVNGSGAVYDVAATLTLEGTAAVAAYGSGVAVFKQPLATKNLHAFSPSGSFLIVVDGTPGDGSYFVTRLDCAGRIVYRKQFRYRPQPVSDAARDSIREDYLDLFSRGSRLQAIAAVREYVQIPAHEPPVHELLVSTENEIWLKNGSAIENDKWLVLGETGSLKAIVDVPPGLRVVLVSSRHLWAVVHDEVDVPFIVRYRIRQSAQ